MITTRHTSVLLELALGRFQIVLHVLAVLGREISRHLDGRIGSEYLLISITGKRREQDTALSVAPQDVLRHSDSTRGSSLYTQPWMGSINQDRNKKPDWETNGQCF